MIALGETEAVQTVDGPTTVRRERIWFGGVVKVRIPKEARLGSCPIDGGELHYLQFCRPVKGGVIYHFVHTEDEALVGKMIHAEVQLWQRTLSDTRKYFYLDFKPVDRSVPLTHRCSVMSAGDTWPNDWKQFVTPTPIRGVVLFSPPEAKVIPLSKSLMSARESDPQLGRLLEAGWIVDSEGATSVALFRLKKGERRTMLHERPKKK